MYQIAIKTDGIERRKKSTGLLHVVAGLILIISAGSYFKQMAYTNFLSVLPFYLVALLSLLYGLFRKKWDPLARHNHWMRMLQFLMFSLLGIYMLKYNVEYHTVSLFLWALICIPLLFTERKVFHDALLVFGNNSITIPGYFSNKVVPWSGIENIVVRRDFVTIHYPGNRYVQYEVLNDVAADDVEKINVFCHRQIQQKAKN